MRLMFSLLFCLILASSCSDQKIDTTKAREEMEAREIKVISDAQIMEAAMAKGKMFLAEMNFSGSIEAPKVMFMADSVFEQGYELFGKETELKDKAFEVFDAYAYNAENGIDSEINIQKLNGGEILFFTAPLVFNDASIGMWWVKMPRKQIVLGIKD